PTHYKPPNVPDNGFACHQYLSDSRRCNTINFPQLGLAVKYPKLLCAYQASWLRIAAGRNPPCYGSTQGNANRSRSTDKFSNLYTVTPVFCFPMKKFCLLRHTKTDVFCRKNVFRRQP